MSASYLLDTHVLLWWLDDPGKLSPAVRDAIADPDSRVLLSVASACEMKIKQSLVRLEIPTDLAAVLRQTEIDVLDIKLAHAVAIADLPNHHRDPFDRMLIAQAQLESLVIMTRDSKFSAYVVDVLEA